MTQSLNPLSSRDSKALLKMSSVYLERCMRWIDHVEIHSSASVERYIADKFPVLPGRPLDQVWRLSNSRTDDTLREFVGYILDNKDITPFKVKKILNRLETSFGTTLFHTLNRMLADIPPSSWGETSYSGARHAECLIFWERERPVQGRFSYGLLESLWTRLHPDCRKAMAVTMNVSDIYFQSPERLLDLSRMPAESAESQHFRNQVAQQLIAEGASLDVRARTPQGTVLPRTVWEDLPGSPWSKVSRAQNMETSSSLGMDERLERAEVRQALAKPVPSVEASVKTARTVRAIAPDKYGARATVERRQRAWDSLLIRHWRNDTFIPQLLSDSRHRGIVLKDLQRLPPNLKWDKGPVRAFLSEHFEPLSKRLWSCKNDADFMEVFLSLQENPTLSFQSSRSETKAYRTELFKVKREARQSNKKTKLEKTLSDELWDSQKRSAWSKVK